MTDNIVRICDYEPRYSPLPHILAHSASIIVLPSIYIAHGEAWPKLPNGFRRIAVRHD